MARSERAKGAAGEREVAAICRAAGLDVQQLQRNRGDTTDLLVAGKLAVDVKRQERLQVPIWIRQAAAEAPAGTVPVVAFRQNRGEWFAALPLAALVELAR